MVCVCVCMGGCRCLCRGGWVEWGRGEGGGGRISPLLTLYLPSTQLYVHKTSLHLSCSEVAHQTNESNKERASLGLLQEAYTELNSRKIKDPLSSFLPDIPGVFSVSPAVFSVSPAVFSVSPGVCSVSPSMFSVSPGVFSVSPGVLSVIWCVLSVTWCILSVSWCVLSVTWYVLCVTWCVLCVT